MTVDVAIALELCHWFLPCCGSRVASCNVGRGCSPWKEPNVDVGARPFGSNDSAANGIELVAVGLCVLVLNVTAGVGTLAWSNDIAISGAKNAGEATVVYNGTAIRCMQCHSIMGAVIDAFNDVDLAFVWPIGADEPANNIVSLIVQTQGKDLLGRPRATDTTRHVREVKNKQAMIV